jgi:hypothetical protein
MDHVSKAQNSDPSGPRKFGKPFVKGQSGNPGGRPKKLHFTKMCEQLMRSKEGKELVKEVMKDILNKRGMAAVLLLREIGERTDGKVIQSMEMSGELQLTLADAVAKARTRVDGLKLLPGGIDAKRG